MLDRPLKRSLGNQSAIGGCKTDLVGLADPAAAKSVIVKWEISD
jgi:hypothetical protein